MEYRKIEKALSSITFSLKPVPPFRLDLTVWVLRRRPDNSIDRWDETTYRRVLVVTGKPVDATVSQTGAPDEPMLQVTVSADEPGLGTAESLDYEGVRRPLAPWKSYGGLIYFHLLLNGLRDAGYL